MQLVTITRHPATRASTPSSPARSSLLAEDGEISEIGHDRTMVALGVFAFTAMKNKEGGRWRQTARRVPWCWWSGSKDQNLLAGPSRRRDTVRPSWTPWDKIQKGHRADQAQSDRTDR
jgi:hypothetical protein